MLLNTTHYSHSYFEFELAVERGNAYQMSVLCPSSARLEHTALKCRREGSHHKVILSRAGSRCRVCARFF